MAELSIDIVQRAQAGDADALLAIVQSQQTYVYNIAYGVMRNSSDAADMTQEAFIRMMRSLGTYRGETRFTTWLYRLVTNICLDGLRRRGRPIDSLDQIDDEEAVPSKDRLADSDPQIQPETANLQLETSEEIRQAMAELPTLQRLSLTLYYFEDARYEDIANILDLPVNTVKSHIRRGKERLATLLTTSEPNRERVLCAATT